MTTEPIRSREEAREQLKRLEKFYGVPVLPLSAFCDGMGTWMDCIIKNNTAPELNKGGMNHGYKYHEALNQMRIDIIKSNLLGRFVLRQGTAPHAHVPGAQRPLQWRSHVFSEVPASL